MKTARRITLISLSLFCLLSLDIYAASDPNATVVLLRASCDDGGGGTLNNCFTSIADLNAGMAGRTTSLPLQVDIGPGTFSNGFSAAFQCGSGTELTLQGAGRDHTTLAGGISASGSCKLNVHDLTMTPAIFTTVYWPNGDGGVSNWVNVNLVGALYAWTETACAAGGEPNRHFFYSSQIRSIGKTYVASCGEHWFLGSEIIARGGGHAGVLEAFEVASEVHVYGSVIRTIIPDNVSIPARTVTVSGSGANIHIHGTGIDIVGNDQPNTVESLVASNGGVIHANASSYNLSTGAGGSVARISSNGGQVHAPYLWEHIPDPAVLPNFSTLNGADQSTVTGGTSDGHPHTVVYSTTCPANARWFDQVDKVCRSQ